MSVPAGEEQHVAALTGAISTTANRISGAVRAHDERALARQERALGVLPA